jgi:hypothetical protein
MQEKVIMGTLKSGAITTAEASASAAPFLGVGNLKLDVRGSNNGDVKVWGNPRCRGVGIRSSRFGGGWLEAGRERSRE